MDGWIKRWKAADGKGSLLCTWCQEHSSICRLRLSWQCPCYCLGDQADIWGFWPGAGLWHLDGWRWRGGGRPEDHLPRVSDSFDLCLFAFNPPSVLWLVAFTPYHCLQHSSYISATHVLHNRVLFSFLFPLNLSSFLPHVPFLSSTSLQPAAALCLSFCHQPFISLLYCFYFISSPPDTAVHKK